MFVILLKYTQPLEKIDELVPAHIEFLKKHYEQSQFICSGRRNPRDGGVILANADSLEAVREILKEDPFYVHQVANYEIIEFTPSRCDPRFACFLKPHD